MSISASPLSGNPAEEPGRLMRDEVTVGIITALPVEYAAMESLLTEVRSLHLAADPNTYKVATLPSADAGKPHRVALVTLPQDGTRLAAATCAEMLRTFPAIRCVIMVGIAGGIPRPLDPPEHVRLGDVVVATEGIVDYGRVRQVDGQQHPRRQAAGWVSSWLRRAVGELRAGQTRGRRPWEHWLDPERTPQARDYPRPLSDSDVLYARGLVVQHPDPAVSGHSRPYPKIHYGAVASADILVRDEVTRDNLAAEFRELVAIEMEGAGVAASTAAHDVPWFMVRGIADYCEQTGKNDIWHAHASYAAAAYVRILLAAAPPAARVLPLVSAEVLDRHAALLRNLPGIDVARVWWATVPDLPEPPASVLSTPERAFQYLSTMNADAGGLSPAVRFLDGLAAACGDTDVTAPLRRAAEELAASTHARRSLDEWRSRSQVTETEPERVQPCLMIEIELDSIDSQMCHITSHLQEAAGRWRPKPGPGYPDVVPLEEAEQYVGEIVDRVEQDEWQSGQVTIEFFLPIGLLNLPVEWWRPHTTRERPLPPLCVDYPIVVRSLERMHRSARPRVWRNRWNALTTTHARNVHWGVDPQTIEDLAAWEVQLRTDENLTAVVLSGSADAWPGEDELDTALRAEVPVILWDRRSSPNTDGRTAIQELIGGDFADLPKRTQQLRAAAAGVMGRGDGSHPGQFIALLWDDPGRTVPLEAAEP